MSLTSRELAKLVVLKGWKEVRVKGSYHQSKRIEYCIFYDSNSWNKVLGAGLKKKMLKDIGL